METRRKYTRRHTFAERFHAKVDRSGGPSACWPWMGCCLRGGYGQIRDADGRTSLAHRIAWELYHLRAIPSDHVVRHSCDHLGCVNHAHLILVGNADRRDIIPLESRFRAKVGPPESGGCMPWTGSRDKNGYGRIGTTANRTMLAHRFALELFNGSPVPDVMDVCHKCDHPWCVNPAHLFIGTASDNLRDMASKGRDRNGLFVGVDGSGAKLRVSDVRKIRKLYGGGVKQSEIASRFSVNQTTISAIVRRRTWIDT